MKGEYYLVDVPRTLTEVSYEKLFVFQRILITVLPRAKSNRSRSEKIELGGCLHYQAELTKPEALQSSLP